MRQLKRWRFYCDFCKKSGGAKWAMEIHEKHCTMNPDRSCRMCGYTDGEGSGGSLQKMIDVIKNGVKDKNEYGEWIFIDLKREAAILTELKNMTTCPACILAALRQSGFPYLFPSFDFKKEKDAMFKEHNADVNQSYAY